MTHQLKKIGSSNFIQAAWDKSYFLSPNYSAQSWAIEDSLEEGNTVEIYCPQEAVSSETFKVGSFYQIFSNYDLVNPIGVFRLYDIQYEYIPNPLWKAYVYKLVGKTYRSIFAENGIILKIQASKIKFKAFMQKIIAQLNAAHPAFSTDDSFVEDVDYTFSSFIAREYADKIFDEIQKYGFKIWFDSSLKMHAISDSSTSTYDIDYDFDLKIKDKDSMRYERNNSPLGQILVIGKNVLSSNYTTETITADGTFDQKFQLSNKPGNPRLVSIDFEKASPDELNAPSLIGGDTIANGRLTINNVASQTFASQYRNYKTSVDCAGGISIGTSVSLNQTTGQCALLALQDNPSDSIGDYVAAFYIDGLTLKLIYNGQVIVPSFPALVPTLKRDISGISSNQVTVSDGTGYTIGQDVIFDLQGETVDVAKITGVAGNVVTVDHNVTYVSGLKLYQQADYLFKFAYYPNSIIFYAKKGTDNNFTVLHEAYLSLNDFRFLQIYANQLHSMSLDWIELTENITIQVKRHNPPYPSYTGRPLDVAFEDSAGRLQAGLQVYLDNTTDKWTLKFPVISNEDESPADAIFIVTNVISSSIFELDFTEGLSIGNRILINKQERFVQGIAGNQITINTALTGVTNSTPIYKSETFPAQNDILEAVYLPSQTVELPLCPSSCLSSEGKTTQIVTIDSQDNLPIQEFRIRAESEKDSICLPQLSGSFAMLIEHNQESKLGHTGTLANIPYAGQKIKLSSTLKPELDQAVGVITSVKISSTGHMNMVRVDVQVGTPLNSIARYLDQLTKRVTRQSILVNENIPDKSFLCTVQEKLNMAGTFNTFTSQTAYSSKNGLYKLQVSGVRVRAYVDLGFTISNTGSKKNAKNGISKIPISGLV